MTMIHKVSNEPLCSNSRSVAVHTENRTLIDTIK